VDTQYFKLINKYLIVIDARFQYLTVDSLEDQSTVANWQKSICDGSIVIDVTEKY
jgi:hypothetical protein